MLDEAGFFVTGYSARCRQESAGNAAKERKEDILPASGDDMAWPGIDEAMLNDARLRASRQFCAGFAEGFGFAGLFAALEQEPLPFAQETQIEPDEPLVKIVILRRKV